MKRTYRHIAATLLTLCAVLSAFYLRAGGEPRRSPIPVQRVFSAAEAQRPPDYRAQREAQRAEELQALSGLADSDERAAEALRALIARAEGELAVEAALSAMGYENAICAIREDAAAICVAQAMDAGQAQRVIELCAGLTGVDAEKVFILDECAYL